jgi:polyprenyl-phospho-N-acetylgalactosaminyl synthase
MVENNGVFIVIPAYNEGDMILSTLNPLIDKGYKVVVVDDCSTDNTKELIKRLPIFYIRHFVNLGQGAALRTGIEYALSVGAEIAVTFDADGQHDPNDIPAMITPIINSEADITLGTRFQRKEDTLAIPYIRRQVLKAAVIFNRVMTGLKLTDAHNGFRALNRQAMEHMLITENRMAHATEILLLIKRNKLRYKEIPVHIKYTDFSISKGQKSMNAFNIAIDVILKKIL